MILPSATPAWEVFPFCTSVSPPKLNTHVYFFSLSFYVSHQPLNPNAPHGAPTASSTYTDPRQPWLRAHTMQPPPSTPRSTAAVALAQAAFHYRVVCEDGAYVRAGLELSSRHLYTIASQSTVEVLERCVNVQGLARLRTADGWISEMLNPLSGQRGPIVEVVPLQHPLKFRILFTGGALVRSGIELSSSIVGTIPVGREIIVTDKRYSNTPSYRCVPRLKLADGSGWISVRINAPAPNETVVELLGLASQEEARAYSAAIIWPAAATSAHGAGMLEGETMAGEEHGGVHAADGGERRRSLAASPASLVVLPVDKQHRPRHHHQHSQQDNFHHVIDASDKIQCALQPYDDDFGAATGTSDNHPQQEQKRRSKEDHSCLVCFSSHRNSTFVHGESGHIACCLECARVLKGRGDPCPVCRLPIDSVIQHFWA